MHTCCMQGRIQDCEGGSSGALGQNSGSGLGTKSPKAYDLLQIILQLCTGKESKTVFCQLSIIDGGFKYGDGRREGVQGRRRRFESWIHSASEASRKLLYPTFCSLGIHHTNGK